mgnify:CR=1 FL=1
MRRVFAQLDSRGRGSHDVRDAGAAGEITGASRGDGSFGDEQPFDVVRTVRNAVLRTAADVRDDSRIHVGAEDFEVVETERRSFAPQSRCWSTWSYSMELRGAWGEAEDDRHGTACARHDQASAGRDRDHRVQRLRRVVSPRALIDHDWDRVQDANLQHALMLARRHIDKHRFAEPVIMVITDGGPTAHVAADGFADFAWPPTRETIAATLAEVERCTTTRSGDQHLHARRRVCRAWSPSCTRSGGATAGGVLPCRHADGSVSTSCRTTCGRGARRRRRAS